MRMSKIQTGQICRARPCRRAHIKISNSGPLTQNLLCIYFIFIVGWREAPPNARAWARHSNQIHKPNPPATRSFSLALTQRNRPNRFYRISQDHWEDISLPSLETQVETLPGRNSEDVWENEKQETPSTKRKTLQLSRTRPRKSIAIKDPGNSIPNITKPT